MGEAIRALTVACRTWAAYPSDHPNVTQAVGTAQARVAEMLASHGSIAIGVARAHLRVGVWTLDSPQARALAQALYRRQAAVLRMERGVEPAELRALVQWLGEPGRAARARLTRRRASGASQSPAPPAPAARLLGSPADRPRGGRVGPTGDLADGPSPQRPPRVGTGRCGLDRRRNHDGGSSAGRARNGQLAQELPRDAGSPGARRRR